MRVDMKLYYVEILEYLICNYVYTYICKAVCIIYNVFTKFDTEFLAIIVIKLGNCAKGFFFNKDWL